MFSLDDLTPEQGDRLRADIRVAIIGGAFSAVLMGVVTLAAGSLSGSEAQVMLQASSPTTRFLCSAVMTASATTLALMLTLLSMSTDQDDKVRGAHYERIRQIAFVDVVAFIGATLFLVLHVVPLGDASTIPVGWFDAVYYVSTVLSALLGGVLVAVMLLLYAAVRDIILTVGPGDETPLLEDLDGE